MTIPWAKFPDAWSKIAPGYKTVFFNSAVALSSAFVLAFDPGFAQEHPSMCLWSGIIVGVINNSLRTMTNTTIFENTSPAPNPAGTLPLIKDQFTGNIRPVTTSDMG